MPGWLCAILMGLCLVPGMVREEPLTPTVQQAWRDMARCSGLPAPFPLDSLHVYSVASHVGFQVAGYPNLWFMGYAFPVMSSIVIVRDSVNSPRLVGHELLHLYVGKPGHPAIPFEICGVR